MILASRQECAQDPSPEERGHSSTAATTKSRVATHNLTKTATVSVSEYLMVPRAVEDIVGQSPLHNDVDLSSQLLLPSSRRLDARVDLANLERTLSTLLSSNPPL